MCEQQYGFMPRKSTTDAIFALRILMEKYRNGQRELHCLFVDLEKAYDRVPREELWYCMRKSGVAEKYVRVVQDMYERSRTVVRCAVGQTEEFKVEVGLHQGSALSPFLFAMVMDQLSEEGSGTVRLQGEEVKKVQELKYLGSTVQSNGEYGKEYKRHLSTTSNSQTPNSTMAKTKELSKDTRNKIVDLHQAGKTESAIGRSEEHGEASGKSEEHGEASGGSEEHGEASGGSEEHGEASGGSEGHGRQGQRVPSDVCRRAEEPSDVRRRAEEPRDVRRRAEKPSDIRRRAEEPSDIRRRAEEPSDVRRRVEEPSDVHCQAEEPSDDLSPAGAEKKTPKGGKHPPTRARNQAASPQEQEKVHGRKKKYPKETGAAGNILRRQVVRRHPPWKTGSGATSPTGTEAERAPAKQIR
ncbi:hypothetical protein QTP86_004721 [Hemibagrus guttatus]|nr:hypothetical protein QTP86_004721 [Hemibagrus guttatus]